MIQTEHKAAQAAVGGAPVYSYRLLWRTPVDGGRMISPHNLDLPFVHDNVALAEHICGPPTAETRTMAEAMAEAWIAFARHGDPNCAAIPSWPPYRLDDRPVMHFDTPPVLERDPHRAERQFLSRYPSQQILGGVLHR